MKRSSVLILTFGLMVVGVPPVLKAGRTSPFTYQGQLKLSEVPINAACEMTFRLWPDPTTTDPRALLGELRFADRSAIAVVNGLFTVPLDFGAELFRGEPRYLEVVVLCPGGPREPVVLRPRQNLTPAPYALYAFDGNPGPAGPPGDDGLSCWDLDGDGVADVEEDINNDGSWNALDCSGDSAPGELTLPFAGTNTTNAGAMMITQQGYGPAGGFVLNFPTTPYGAVTATSSGTGPAFLGTNSGAGAVAVFSTPGGTNTSWTLKAENVALGQAAYFNASNNANTSPTIESWNTASGPAAYLKTTRDPGAGNTTPTLDVENDSWGSAASFRSSNETNSSDVVKILHLGGETGAAGGRGLFVDVNAPAYAVHAQNAGGSGAGHFQVTKYANIAPAIYAVHNGRGSAAHFKTTDAARDRPTVLVEMNDDEAGVQSEASGTGDAIFGWSKGTGTAVRGLSEGTGGIAGWFQINGTTHSSTALRASTNGTGKGLFVETTNASSQADAVHVANAGRGNAALFQNTSATSRTNAVTVEHKGDGVGLFSRTWGEGAAIKGYATFDGPAVEGMVDGGTGNAGKFSIVNPTSAQAVVTATTNGTGVAGFFENTNTVRAGFNSAIHAKTAAATGYAGYFEGRGYFSTKLGIGTDTPGHALDVVGRIRTHELEITAGADLSESFDISTDDQKIEPGMVVSIDPRRPGKLTISRCAYDRKVAGVVSGAGGVATGMMMKHDGTLASGEHAVALTGRVYCLVDASKGAVEPGDLLTTSDTPGHAMKVSDYSNVQGAIIGKAMTPLKEGRGLVLVLVNLQ